MLYFINFQPLFYIFIMQQWELAGKNISMYYNERSFIEQRSTEELGLMLDFAIITPSIFVSLFNNIARNRTKTDIIDILTHVTVNFESEPTGYQIILNSLSRLLNVNLFSNISEYIMRKETSAASEKYITEINELNLRMLSYNDSIQKLMQENKTYSEQFINLRTELNTLANKFGDVNIAMRDGIKQVKDVSSNVNIQNLKKFKKNRESFYDIYELLQKCANEDDKDAIEYAVKEKYVDVKDRDKYFNTYDILNYTAFKNNFKLAKMLISSGADYNSRSSFGSTAFYHFCNNGNLEAVEFFAKLPNIDCNSANNDGWTTLMAVCLQNHVDVFKFLINLKNINVNARSKRGETAMMLTRNDEVKNLLRSHGAI